VSPTFRFIPAMYRAAVVDRVKTQTRRVITPQPREDWRPEPGPCYNYAPTLVDRHGEMYPGPEVFGIATEDEGWIATYGPPGTVLPVVTTWAVDREWDDTRPSIMDPDVICSEHLVWWNDGSTKPAWAGKSRPAMFFPGQLYPFARQARVVSVKAERVQDISALEAIAEGIAQVPHGNSMWYYRNYLFESAHPKRGVPIDDEKHRVSGFYDPIPSYRTLWDSINAERGKGELKGQYAWKRNPWVFATTFEVLHL